VTDKKDKATYTRKKKTTQKQETERLNTAESQTIMKKNKKLN
jgi:hypothetical protein